MPTQAVERIVEQHGAMAPGGARKNRAIQRETRHRAKFDVHLASLARTLATADASDLDASLLPTLEALGLGVEADRVTFFAGNFAGNCAGNRLATPNSPDCFHLRGEWRPGSEVLSASDQTTSIDLDRLPDRGRGMRAGEVQRLAGVSPFGNVDAYAQDDAVAHWVPARTTLYLPCLASVGLLGLFAVEGGVPASRWHGSILDRAASLGQRFAVTLDRHRLALELDSIRTRQGHGERLETLGRIASGVAHDFNNVLTAILGNADLLEMELADAGDGHNELAEIRAAATRAAELVEHVLCFGRVHRGGIRSVDLADCVTGLKGMLERVLGDGIALDLALAPADEVVTALVRIDPGRFERALLNLAANARIALATVKDAPCFSVSFRRVGIDAEGRDVRVVGSVPIVGVRAGEFIRVTAADNGCGMDPLLVKRIFEPFFTTRETSGGTGLGLSTTAEVMREVGGGIHVETALGEGTAFHLYIPAVPVMPAIPGMASDPRYTTS